MSWTALQKTWTDDGMARKSTDFVMRETLIDKYRWAGIELSDSTCTSNRLQKLLNELKILPDRNSLTDSTTLSYMEDVQGFNAWENLWHIRNAKCIPILMAILKTLVADESTAQHAWTSMVKYSGGNVITLSVMEILCLCAERGAQPKVEELQKILKRNEELSLYHITRSEELTLAFLKTLAALHHKNRLFTCDLQFLGDFYVISQEMLQLGRQLVHAVYGTMDSCLKSGKLIDILLFFSNSHNDTEIPISDSSCENWLKRSPLHLAAIILDSKKAWNCFPKNMIKNNLDKKDLHGCTPLHLAHLHHNEYAIQFLISLGAQRDVQDKFGMSPAPLGRTTEGQPDDRYKELCHSVLEAKCGILKEIRPLLVQSEIAAEALSGEVKTLFERLIKWTQYENAQIFIAGSVREKLKAGRLDEVDVILKFKKERVSKEELLACLGKTLADISFEGTDLRPISIHGPWKFLREGMTVSVDVVVVFVDNVVNEEAHRLQGRLLWGNRTRHNKMVYFTLETWNCQGDLSFKATHFAYEWDIIDSLQVNYRLAIVIAKALLQAYDLCRNDMLCVTLPVTSYMIKTALFYFLVYQFDQRHLNNQDLKDSLNFVERKVDKFEKRRLNMRYAPQPKWLTDEDVDKHGGEARVWGEKIFMLIKFLAQRQKKLKSYWDREYPLARISGFGEAECILDVCDHALECLSSSEWQGISPPDAQQQKPDEPLRIPLKEEADVLQEQHKIKDEILKPLEELTAEEGSAQPDVLMKRPKWALNLPDKTETYKTILEELNLTDYYPGKITLMEARKLRKTSEKKLSDVPWILINKLFNGDLHARDSTMSQVLVSSEDDGIDDFMSKMDKKDKKDTNGMLSTLDVLVVLFGCCDNFLQQTLAQKLFQCKLAIPFIYPLGTPNKMLLSLWSLRTIEIVGAFAVETPMPIVAFLKLGQLPHFSKSKLMNDILSDNNHHTFVNYHCPNGIEERVLSDGLVECSWYVNATKDDSVDSDALPSSMMLLNLRGDASKLHQLRDLLCNISSIIVILATASELVKHVESYKSIKKSAKVIPLIFIKGDTLPEMEREKSVLHECLGKSQPITNKKKDGKTKGDNLLKADICKALAKNLKGLPVKVLENCFDQQSSNFLTIDEHKDDCDDGKRNAKKAVDPLFKVAVCDRKKVCLPLQEDEWKQFCKLKKDRHRVCSEKDELTIQQQIDKIDSKMLKRREVQLDLCKHMSYIAVQFTASLISGGQEKVQFFLNWMKIMLDKESRAQTSDIRRKYGVKWDELQIVKEDKNRSEISKLADEVSRLENELATASIGLEHFFRELGQMYEALHEYSSENRSLRTLKTEPQKFPYVAADLLLKGYPLELLDGDAPGIPITWIRAVFDQLTISIRDKKLFVLSVLGIQSSGKSTLLNTMFGLQFAVSAGRCTRGAYIQLIPVDESASLPFNYVLVIDTEGLRAPQLASSKHAHDNELATFAVGLADVTVVNIKGENVSEIQDVLQIVVHAFIRMKAVNSNQDYRRACVFIHQNVSDINAKDMMMHERHKIVEKLDKITREAALSENVGDVTSFHQIINFDQKKHVWYFPDLWLGNPPMAPVNPKYSQKVEEVKDYLLNEIAKNQMMFLNPADLFTRINDLWKGILCEDFVFNFRNSLEVRAYAQLDSMYNSLIWELQKMVIAFRQEKATKDLTECRKTSSLPYVANVLVSKLAKEVSEKVENLKKDLEKYFRESEYNEIIIQWKATKMLGLDNEGERQKEESRIYMNDMKEECKMKLIQSEEAGSHLDEIINMANQLADKIKGRDLQESTIRKEFDKIWMAFIQKHEVKTRDNTVRVEALVEEVLMDIFRAHRELLRQELDVNPLRIPLRQALVASITINDIKKDHLNQKLCFSIVSDKIGITHYLHEAKIYLYQGTSHMFEKVEQSLKNMCNPKEQFQELTIRKLFKELQQEMDELLKQVDSRGFLIVPAYWIKVAVLVGRQAVKQFLEAQKEYVAKYSAQAYLEKYHKMVWDLFKNRVKESTAEITVKDIFCDLIEEFVLEKMQERAALLLTSKVMNDFSHGKFHLISNILKDLANKECFENYVGYLNNAKNFASRFIWQYFDENVFAGKKSEYAEVATDILVQLHENLLKCISEATEQMNEKKEKSLTQWIDLIRGKSELSMPENKFEPMYRQGIVNDYNHLKNIITNELKWWVANQLKEISCKATVTQSWKDYLADKVMQSLWGCPAHCPFCKEPCSITDPNHVKERSHSCIKHKPQGINGGYWYHSVKLVTDTCGFLLHTKCLFLCGYICGNCTSGKEWHKYEEYTKYVPEWNIEPDPANDSSKYWMWFMAKYKKDLVRYYEGRKLPDIPVAWENITKQEALDDLVC